MGLRDAGEAHVTARYTDPVLGDCLTNDNEAERTHDKGGRSKPQRRNPEWKRDQACHQASSDKVDVEGGPIVNRQEAGRIGSDAEERGLSQRQEARITNQKIEPMRRKEEDQGNDDGVER